MGPVGVVWRLGIVFGGKAILDESKVMAKCFGEFKAMRRDGRIVLAPAVALIAIVALSVSSMAAETKIPVTFSGGHEIGKDDFGRPIPLIAAALGVEPEVFRKAFGGVILRRKTTVGLPVAKEEVALFKVLAPHALTNEHLDEVSDYYRYQPHGAVNSGQRLQPRHMRSSTTAKSSGSSSTSQARDTVRHPRSRWKAFRILNSR